MRAFIMISLVTALFFNVGCAQEKSSASGQQIDPSCRGCGDGGGGGGGGGGQLPPPPGGTGEDPGETGFDSGSTSELILSGGVEKLAQMFFQSSPNNPTNIRINIDIRRSRDAVIISYIDNGRLVEAAFGTVNPVNPGVSNSMYNGWVNQGGKSVWKGFFQDRWGAIVLIIDKQISTGDGQPAKFVGGSVWFQNFNNQYYPNNPVQGPLAMCWEISRGPYDCRSFLVNNYVSMTSSYYPTTRGPDKTVNYQMLGTFNGIAASAAGF